MKTYLTRKIAFAAAAVLALGGTSGAEEVPIEPFFTTFDEFTQGEWYIADFKRKQPWFVTGWDFDQIHLTDDDQLELSLDTAPINSGKLLRGGKVQRHAYSHYGRYEVAMTAARGNGVISSFYTYTGPYFNDPWDEIDFEFLGRDTTKVWVTRFADGERLPGSWIDLGFDAADGHNLYTFDWTPEAIIWYVNGAEIFRVEAKDRTLPTTPGRILMSVWGGSEKQRQWSGVAPRNTSTKVAYDCVSYVPTGETGQQCSDLPAYNYSYE